jgi:hypothetical protein
MAEGRTTWPPVKDGWFVEPEAATLFLLERERFDDGFWDPACGQGNIVETGNRCGYSCVGTDLRDRTESMDTFRRKRASGWFEGAVDFMEWDLSLRPFRHHIVSNPPYGRALLAELFIRQACGLPGVEKVAMFLNSKFMYGGKRALGLYQDLPPDRVYPISPRPSCPPGEFLLAGGKAEGGVENFAWFVWSMSARTGRTELIWS